MAKLVPKPAPEMLSRFMVGQKVKARRVAPGKPPLLMTVGTVGMPEPAGRMYQCIPDEEHASHGKGQSVRWFREQDLDVA